ncbi:hypothetical protein DEO72_LG1g2689 [Vigna unguiculata]|uniref:Uncharacterized protein n=1 Tax=Vigna unguiculata TaxID=3917 RepID=A0A4D6KNC0_VIGUN|nr:hypothetical protein DEO72_LG1g2689 [Vigna unguiculata]
MKVRTSSGFGCSNAGDVQNSMRRLAVPRLPPGAIPENGVLDVVKGGVVAEGLVVEPRTSSGFE